MKSLPQSRPIVNSTTKSIPRLLDAFSPIIKPLPQPTLDELTDAYGPPMSKRKRIPQPPRPPPETINFTIPAYTNNRNGNLRFLNQVVTFGDLEGNITLSEPALPLAKVPIPISDEQAFFEASERELRENEALIARLDREYEARNRPLIGLFPSSPLVNAPISDEDAFLEAATRDFVQKEQLHEEYQSKFRAPQLMAVDVITNQSPTFTGTALDIMNEQLPIVLPRSNDIKMSNEAELERKQPKKRRMDEPPVINLRALDPAAQFTPKLRRVELPQDYVLKPGQRARGAYPKFPRGPIDKQAEVFLKREKRGVPLLTMGERATEEEPELLTEAQVRRIIELGIDNLALYVIELDEALRDPGIMGSSSPTEIAKQKVALKEAREKEEALRVLLEKL